MTAGVRQCCRCGEVKSTLQFHGRGRTCAACRAAEAASEAAKPTHEQWQAQVVQLAHLLRWEHLHVRRTRGRGGHWTTSTNVEGWPDLFLWKRGVGFCGVELKVPGDYPTQEQLDVLVALQASGAATCVAYPDDLDRLTEVLRGRSAGWVYDGKVRA